MLTVERPNTWCELKRGECFLGDLLKMIGKDASSRRSALAELGVVSALLSSGPQTQSTRAALAHVEAAIRKLSGGLWENN